MIGNQGYDLNTNNPQGFDTSQQGQDFENGEDNEAHRPPNAFILYSNAMRSKVRSENPALSNTEVSRLLGTMWKEVSNDIKQQYKQKASSLQDEFKKTNPDYTYRKARRKRALNELLTKSTGGYPQGQPFYPMAMGQPMYALMGQQQQLMNPQGMNGMQQFQMMQGMQNPNPGMGYYSMGPQN